MQNKSFSSQQMNAVWDLSNEAYPGLLHQQQRLERAKQMMRRAIQVAHRPLIKLWLKCS